MIIMILIHDRDSIKSPHGLLCLLHLVLHFGEVFSLIFGEAFNELGHLIKVLLVTPANCPDFDLGSLKHPAGLLLSSEVLLLGSTFDLRYLPALPLQEALVGFD